MRFQHLSLALEAKLLFTWSTLLPKQVLSGATWKTFDVYFTVGKNAWGVLNFWDQYPLEVCSCLHHNRLSLYVFCVSDPCKYLFSTKSWKLRSCTGEEWSLQSWRLSGKNPLPDVKEEVALVTLSSISERQMLILKLSVEGEEHINFFFPTGGY